MQNAGEREGGKVLKSRRSGREDEVFEIMAAKFLELNRVCSGSRNIGGEEKTLESSSDEGETSALFIKEESDRWQTLTGLAEGPEERGGRIQTAKEITFKVKHLRKRVK